LSPTPRGLLDRRLIVVSGKGGVGKTAVACTVAEAARRAGKRVLLVETATHEAVASRFERAPRPLGHAGRTLAPGLHALRIDPHEALAEYIRLQIGLGAVTDRILRTELFGQLLEAAPGWRELIVLGKIWHLEQRSERDGRPSWDLIVVDAPATGHGLTFLDVPRVVAQAVRSGPLARHAGWVEALVHDPERTLLLPVTLPEELPVRETIELVERARREIRIAVDRIVVNQMPSERSTSALAALSRARSETPLSVLPKIGEMRALLEHGVRRTAEARRFRLEVAERCELPVIEIPAWVEGFDAGSGWVEHAESILDAPYWPQANDESVRVTGAA